MTKGIVWFLLASAICLAQADVLDDLVKKTIQEVTRDYETVYRNYSLIPHSARPLGNKNTPEHEEIGFISNVQHKALDVLTNTHGVDREVALHRLRRQTPAACQQPNTNCNFNSRYRTIEGVCNNINNVLWGARNQAVRRVAPAAYEDGVSVPRGGRPNSRLPSARVVSLVMHPDSNTPNLQVTNMVPQFGQFLDHDITMTPEGNRQCCTGQQDQDCWPISIPSNDPFHRGQRTCMDFTRSTSFCFANTGRREQINANTAFIDASQVYGSTNQRTQSLRAFAGGRLISNNQGLNGFLPTASSLSMTNSIQGTFAAGDDRVNENPGLTVMQNVFLMEHNRIANELSRLVNWNDETIFQEARRIVGAEMQQIVYNEYLPIVLGETTMSDYNLRLPSALTNEYTSGTDPSIFNSFSTAAYRFGHSMVPGVFRMLTVNGSPQGSYNVRDNFFQSGMITQNNGQGYDWILKGLMTQNAQDFDPFVTADLTNFLFKTSQQNFGADLAARNIQRGRDHGLPSYNTYRNLCGMQTISSWSQNPPEIRADAWQRLSSVYSSPNDIDLFTGGLIENHVADGLTGPTFNCLKATQFARLKFGDRYFFTHLNGGGGWRPGQLAEIRKRTLGDIICQNSQQISTPLNVFLVASSSNPEISCTDARRRMDLTKFVQNI